ncbi:hypothetical protein CYMTET_46085 [Cymbomonas tetramitiformis]|uniref:Uncharacterized protein n=1 Tax=Cymbomonas tetramitiformis TaxID=36881 RepID=A0AAE0EXE4_9CHLO|nr:hypothetical protein CYMTET_46085 [Cymbomonas tetramitiformis]
MQDGNVGHNPRFHDEYQGNLEMQELYLYWMTPRITCQQPCSGPSPEALAAAEACQRDRLFQIRERYLSDEGEQMVSDVEKLVLKCQAGTRSSGCAEAARNASKVDEVKPPAVARVNGKKVYQKDQKEGGLSMEWERHLDMYSNTAATVDAWIDKKISKWRDNLRNRQVEELDEFIDGKSSKEMDTDPNGQWIRSMVTQMVDRKDGRKIKAGRKAYNWASQPEMTEEQVAERDMANLMKEMHKKMRQTTIN